jgi:hypothetical protein
MNLGYSYWPLFKHMSQEHKLTLTESEMDEICRVVQTMICYPAAREGTDADGAGVAQKLSLEAHLPACPDNAGTQRPGTPDGSLATETRKPGSLE